MKKRPKPLAACSAHHAWRQTLELELQRQKINTRRQKIIMYLQLASYTHRPPFTRKLRKWKTFCVVHPYSGTLNCILTNWIYNKEGSFDQLIWTTKSNRKAQRGGTGTTAMTETIAYRTARMWKIRSCQTGDSFTSHHQFVASFRLSEEEDDDDGEDRECIRYKPPPVLIA